MTSLGDIGPDDTTPTSAPTSQNMPDHPSTGPKMITSNSLLSKGPSNQHDIIQLLAQHFNNQFYQLSRNMNSPNMIDMNNAALHHGAAHYQQQLLHNSSQQLINTELIGHSFPMIRTNRHELAGQPLSPPKQNINDRLLANSLFEANHVQSIVQPSLDHQRMNTTECANEPHLNLTDSKLLPPTNCVSQSANSPLPDLNFFKALNCFSLNNDQLMLALHQQYMLQAASMATHLKDASLDTQINGQFQINQLSRQNQVQQQISSLKPRRTQATNRSQKSVVDFSRSSTENGREMLKFGINTILGHASPVPTSSNIPPSRLMNSDEMTLDREDRSKILGDKEDNRVRHHMEGRVNGLSSPDCDPVATDLSSDSSVNVSPAPQAVNQQESYNPYRGCSSATEHQSASDLPNQVGRLHQVASSDAVRSMVNNQHTHHASLSFLASSPNFPWTVAARGKPRRGMMRRAVFSDSQRVGLEKRFQLQKYISKPDRKKLADKLGLRDSQVKIWFQNRRMKWRNSKERELLSAGGSREQTLPTRNNPNPDLSDVGETIKKAASSNGNNIL